MKRIIAIDTNIFIYLLDGMSPNNKKARSLFAHIEGGEYHAIASTIVLLELMRRPNPELLNALASIKNMSFMEVTVEVAVKAAELSVNFGKKLKPYDELHLATALIGGAEQLYTNDADLVSLKNSPIKISSIG